MRRFRPEGEKIQVVPSESWWGGLRNDEIAVVTNAVGHRVTSGQDRCMGGQSDGKGRASLYV